MDNTLQKKMATLSVHTGAGTDAPCVRLGGDWTVEQAGDIQRKITELPLTQGEAYRIDAAQIRRLDTTGALLLIKLARRCGSDAAAVIAQGGLPERLKELLSVVDSHIAAPALEPPARTGLLHLVEQVGETALWLWKDSLQFIAFVGAVVQTFFFVLTRPRRFRFTSLVFSIEQVGLNALPIVGLISFLIGVVLAYQGASQLRRFGAEIFVVDLIAISVLREVGILLTAIVVAGRSGSAFTAQIGSMVVHEEVDAMRTIGLDPMEVLVLPRVLALVIALPLLAFFSDILGLIGGGLMAWVTQGLSPVLFMERLQENIGFWTFGVGMIKAPVFAALISLVGCYEGFQVSGSAESVGRQTTRSVVEAIFLVIVADAVFSIFFNMIGI